MLTVSGLMPSEIGSLSQLLKMSMRSQYSIPSEIGKLSKLGKKMSGCSFEMLCSVGWFAQRIFGNETGLDLTIWCTNGQYLPKEICSPKLTFNLKGCRCN
jgi:hypothetical protein